MSPSGQSEQHRASVPPLTAEQRRAALHRAADARAVRADLKRRLKEGKLTFAGLLDRAASDEAVAKMKVIDAITSMPGIGPATGEQIMARLNIAASRRLRGLGAHQRAGLLREFDDEQ